MYDAEAITAFEQVKRAFDPADLLNPGVIVRPADVAADLRVPTARPAHALGMPLKFAYSRDEGDLTRAVHRCVGVGKCRADSGGVMCPSYLATGDEKDSTAAGRGCCRRWPTAPSSPTAGARRRSRTS